MKAGEYEINSDLNQADSVLLREKYNDILGDLIISKLLEMPEDLRQPLYNEIMSCLFSRRNGV